MSIPLDRLYHFIEGHAKSIFNDDVLIYRFFPHGSKKVEDLQQLSPLDGGSVHWVSTPEIYCNDQEPLNYALYDKPISRNYLDDMIISRDISLPSLNFRGMVQNVWDHCILLHSEKNSSELFKYESSNFIPVYYWSHAIIALDWFRYAKFISPHDQPSRTFLIYNRAWSGTREYRLKFSDLLIESGLESECMTWCNPIDPDIGIHYRNHEFIDAEWVPNNSIEAVFSESKASSYASADFDIQDYSESLIEVVLETLFSDMRNHITEKSLRPIAVGKPFILASTPLSLSYLRSYGFKTFSDVWDESYDMIGDHSERLRAIVELMKQIASWSPSLKQEKIKMMNEICAFNKSHFFSNEFFNRVSGELITNLNNGMDELIEKNRASLWLERHGVVEADTELRNAWRVKNTDEVITQMYQLAQRIALRAE